MTDTSNAHPPKIKKYFPDCENDDDDDERYTRLSDVVDQMFPPLEYTAKEADFLSDYSYFNYWKRSDCNHHGRG